MKRISKQAAVPLIGRALVVARLNRMKIPASVEKRGVVRAGEGKGSILLHIKTTNYDDVQFSDVGDFLTLNKLANKKLIATGKASLNRGAIYVFVKIGACECGCKDEFYIIKHGKFQDIVARDFDVGGNPIPFNSTHYAKNVRSLWEHRDAWKIIEKALGLKPQR
ncbi:MAG: hypothetical protein OD811_04345 [Alphaproteobacteria bacterium]